MYPSTRWLDRMSNLFSPNSSTHWQVNGYKDLQDFLPQPPGVDGPVLRYVCPGLSSQLLSTIYHHVSCSPIIILPSQRVLCIMCSLSCSVGLAEVTICDLVPSVLCNSPCLERSRFFSSFAFFTLTYR